MAASEKLLIDGLMTAAAVGGSDRFADHEAVVVRFFLSGGGLMTIEASDILGGMRAELEFMHDRVLQSRLALSTFAGGANKGDVRLIGFDFRPLGVDKKRGEDEAEANDEGDEDGAERHNQ